MEWILCAFSFGKKSLWSDNMANNMTVLQQHHLYKLAKQIKMSPIWFLIDISVFERMSKPNISIIYCVEWLLSHSVIFTQPFSITNHQAPKSINPLAALTIIYLFDSYSIRFQQSIHCNNSLVLMNTSNPVKPHGTGNLPQSEYCFQYRKVQTSAAQ